MVRTVTRARRADAERSIAAILDAAVDLLGVRPEASMEEIAAAAGLSRQTVYAHFSSREALLDAASRRAMAEAVTAIEAAEPERGPPAEALERLVAVSWQTVARHAGVIESMHTLRGAQEQHAFHAPIRAPLERLIRRGKRAGVFDRRQPTPWLLAAFISLSHAAAAEVSGGRMDPEDAGRALVRSVLRVFGVDVAGTTPLPGRRGTPA
jgi:AcrR family transcriptional regulator